ncbi:hypothetical protein BGX26_009618 [Mortierella sp. AD094]|nr:hypothetical protein BGX26_009618 [Mortierella sp. AD094]
MGNKEMICPLCRFLHKDQPFMGSDAEDTKPPHMTAAAAAAAAAIATANHTLSINTTSSMTSAIRNRHRTNSIHLQHNLSNMVQHQQRRQSIYELRRASVSSPTTATATANTTNNSSTTSTAASSPSSSLPSSASSLSPSSASFPSALLPSALSSTAVTTAAAAAAASTVEQHDRTDGPERSLFSMFPFLDSSRRRRSHSSYTQQRQSLAATARHQQRGTLVKVTPFPHLMFYGLPSFSIAVLLMAFIMGQVDTLWSKISCFIGSLVFYMLCWVFVVQIIAPSAQDYQQQQDNYFQDQAAAAAAATAAVVAMVTPTGMTTTSATSTTTIDAFNGMSISNAMEYEFDVQDSFTPTDISASYAAYYSQIGSPHPAALQQQQLQQERQRLLQQQQQRQEQQQQQQQQQQQSSSSSAGFPFCSVAQWIMSNQYAQNLVRRFTDLVEIMDDYSETFGHW